MRFEHGLKFVPRGNSKVEPGRKETGGSGSEQRLLEFVSGVAAGFGTACGAKRYDGAKGRPFAAAGPASWTEGGEAD
ncbi:MAG TPA: hypothetical protein VMH48_05325 [Methylomirabilota bacterium]|nr:hypothetical protein [Methylomirabilota bacterium]